VDTNCNRAYCGLERGSTEENLHWQCVMSAKLGIHQRSLHSLIKRVFWGPGKPPRYAHVRVVALTHKGELHTFGGMVGYCAKDMDEPYFKCVAKGDSLELLKMGRDIHLAFGAGGTYLGASTIRATNFRLFLAFFCFYFNSFLPLPTSFISFIADLKGRCALHPENIMTRAYIFWKQHLARTRAGCTFFEVLEEMLKTGKFYPGYKWLEGRSKLEDEQVEALWKIMVKPKSMKAEREWIYATFYKDVRP
jgi:hypothetical protein